MRRMFSILLVAAGAWGADEPANKLSSYPVVSTLSGQEYFPIFVPGTANYRISADALSTWLLARVPEGGASGDGSALVNLNASALASGTVPAGRLSAANLVTALGYTPTAAGGATIPLDIERAVPINMRDVNTGGNRSSANQTGTLRWQLVPSVACHDVQLLYQAMYRPSGDYLTALGNSVTIKCALEINGKIFQAYFGGHRSTVVESGATAVSDPIYCMIKPTDIVYVRTYYDAGAGDYIPTTHTYQGVSAGTGNDSITYGVDVVDTAGALGAISQPLSWGPASVIAVPDSSSRISVVMIGDSIIYGSGEAFANDASLWSRPWGFCARALLPVNIGFAKLCVGGDTISYWTNSSWMRIPPAKGGTIVVCNYGINDLSAGTSVAALKTNLKTVWGYWASKRCKMYQTTITPSSTSTDGFTSAANQTPFAYEANRGSLNAWLRDGSGSGAVAESGGALAGVFDVAATVEVSGGKWAVTNAALYSGTVTSAGSNWAQDSNQSTIANHSLDYAAVIKITGGTGAGQVQTITANSPQNKYYVASWTTQPDATSTYEIWWVYTSDGLHPRSVGHAAMASAVNAGVFSWP